MKEWSEEEEEDGVAFSKGSITVRTPPQKCSTPTDVPMAPKKKETTPLVNTSKPQMETETDASIVTETPPSMARNTGEAITTHGKAAKPALKTTQANNSLSTVEAACLETEMPIETPDVGTESPPPLESDPFDLHGCTLLACFRTIQADIQKSYKRAE